MEVWQLGYRTEEGGVRNSLADQSEIEGAEGVAFGESGERVDTGGNYLALVRISWCSNRRDLRKRSLRSNERLQAPLHPPQQSCGQRFPSIMYQTAHVEHFH